MIKDTTELLTILNKNKLIIEEFFEKRDRDIYLNDISSDDNFSDKIEYLLNVGILEMADEPFSLSETLISFLENMLQTNRRIEIRGISEDLDYLEEKISDYKNRDLIDKQKKYLREITRTLSRINRAIVVAFNVISQRVTLEYTTQTNSSEKVIELNRYREKIKELISTEREVDHVVKRELAFFKNSHNRDLLQTFYILAQTLRELRVSLVELQQIVIEYINKSEQKRLFFEKILKLQEMIKNQEIKEKTNIEKLVQQKSYPELFFLKKRKTKTQLSLNILDYYTEDFEERLKKVISNFSIEDKEIKKAPKIDDESLDSKVEYSYDIDKYALQRAFRGMTIDLFTFLDNKNYEREIELEDKLLLYSQMITLFEKEYEYTKSYKIYDRYRVLDIYNKRLK